MGGGYPKKFLQFRFIAHRLLPNDKHNELSSKLDLSLEPKDFCTGVMMIFLMMATNCFFGTKVCWHNIEETKMRRKELFFIFLLKVYASGVAPTTSSIDPIFNCSVLVQ